ncbi:hypothetical protein ABW21_db0206715 [Orbilia brochopaga]|nr:hypothetical protein ABW21_db0206715 [Drechslerella brochopaga]
MQRPMSTKRPTLIPNSGQKRLHPPSSSRAKRSKRQQKQCKTMHVRRMPTMYICPPKHSKMKRKHSQQCDSNARSIIPYFPHRRHSQPDNIYTAHPAVLQILLLLLQRTEQLVSRYPGHRQPSRTPADRPLHTHARTSRTQRAARHLLDASPGAAPALRIDDRHTPIWRRLPHRTLPPRPHAGCRSGKRSRDRGAVTTGAATAVTSCGD